MCGVLIQTTYGEFFEPLCIYNIYRSFKNKEKCVPVYFQSAHFQNKFLEILTPNIFNLQIIYQCSGLKVVEFFSDRLLHNLVFQ